MAWLLNWRTGVQIRIFWVLQLDRDKVLQNLNINTGEKFFKMLESFMSLIIAFQVVWFFNFQQIFAL